MSWPSTTSIARDLAAALAVVEQALEALADQSSPTFHRVAADFRRRRDRLRSKRPVPG